MMSGRSAVVAGLAAALLAGCGSQSKPVPMSAHYNFDSGRYRIEVVTEGPTGSSINSHFTDDGRGTVDELVEITHGDSLKLRIENGKLTVNGKDRGALAKGDRIKVDAAGRVLVNDVER
jgi:hypothetical protein